MNDIYSFYQLISKYYIEIPIIQRDYAQGRDNSKAADVRKSLVEKIISAVTNNNGRLFFDFVYGRIEGNKFIPFDGQQRLTTLFLFHKYVFEKCLTKSDCGHKNNCICEDILGRFSYATRQSSREFCEKLVQENVIPSDDKKVSDNIKNQPWFYPDWQKDPTILGMLTMLDEIHSQTKQVCDFKTIAENLTSGCDCHITFHFVDMGEHKLSDDTYVKMNARGKQLTQFENFKASLEQYLEEKNNDNLLDRLKGKYNEQSQKYTGIDGEWLDLFWNVENTKKSEKKLPDNLMMSFFNRHFVNVWVCWFENQDNNTKEAEENFNNRIASEIPLSTSNDDYVPWELYEHILETCGAEKCIVPIFNILDELCKNDTIKNNIENNCQAVWNRSNSEEQWDFYHGKIEKGTETYPSRAAFYALMRYYNKAEEKKITLEQWMRVCWNIIENYVERENSYRPALKLIDTIANKDFDISQLKDNEYSVAQEQVKEEIDKAKQILNGTNRQDVKSWEEIIKDAEKYAFFNGAIRFLFQNENGDVNWDDFDIKWNNAKKYFDKKGKGVSKKFRKDALLLRRFLSSLDLNSYDKEFWFGNNRNFWRTSLLDKKHSHQIDTLLKNNDAPVNSCCKDWIKDDQLLYQILKDEDDSWHILENWRGYPVLTRYTNRVSGVIKSPKLVIVLEHLRDNLLSIEKITVNNDNKIADECNYLYGWDVDFTYDRHSFRWYGKSIESTTELDVYLMKDDRSYYKKNPDSTSKVGTDEDEYYCFKVEDNMTSDAFIEKLNDLIRQAEED